MASPFCHKEDVDILSRLERLRALFCFREITLEKWKWIKENFRGKKFKRLKKTKRTCTACLYTYPLILIHKGYDVLLALSHCQCFKLRSYTVREKATRQVRSSHCDDFLEIWPSGGYGTPLCTCSINWGVLLFSSESFSCSFFLSFFFECSVIKINK